RNTGGEGARMTVNAPEASGSLASLWTYRQPEVPRASAVIRRELPGDWISALASPCAQNAFPPVPPALRSLLRLCKRGRRERVGRRPREIHLHLYRGHTVLGKRLARRHPILPRAKLHEARRREEHPSWRTKAHKATVCRHLLAQVA